MAEGARVDPSAEIGAFALVEARALVRWTGTIHLVLLCQILLCQILLCQMWEKACPINMLARICRMRLSY